MGRSLGDMVVPFLGGCNTLGASGRAFSTKVPFFRWFKFTLKPPNSMACGNFFLAIWDTFHWNFFVKFGLKTPYDIS